MISKFWRRLEPVTWKDVAVRYTCGNAHPDHDAICDFGVRNEEAGLNGLSLAPSLRWVWGVAWG